MREDISDERLVTVFEAVNETLRETYVGLTALLIPALVERLGKTPPKEVAHWRPEHRVLCRGLLYSIPKRDAAGFIDGLEESFRKDGWRFIRQGRR